jgi:hypothetical protein
MDANLSQWIFTCIRTPYLSILNFESLDINLTTYGNFSKGISKPAEDTYIKLETRLNGFINKISENIKDEKLDSNLVSYLNVLITEESFVPKEFFVLFEYCRINTQDNLLKNILENQKQMILCVYIFCKIICKNILLEKQFGKGAVNSNKVNNNFKMCASVIYRGVIDYFKSKCNIVRKIKNIKDFKDLPAEFSNRKKVFYDILFKKPVGAVDKSYTDVCKRVATRSTASITDPLITKKEEKMLQNTIEKMPVYEPDANENEIDCIFKQVYQPKELTGYNTLAEKHKYDINALMIQCIDKLINFINSYKNN